MAHKKQPALFDDRFMESFAGNGIVNDQKIAVIELIANAWDAGATEVRVSWPLDDGEDFIVSDNGHGMTENEFNLRYRTLAYNRIKELGHYAEIPNESKNVVSKRPVFGKNGKGRLGGFAFGSTFIVETSKDGFCNKFKVSKDTATVMSFQKVEKEIETSEHGTKIIIKDTTKAKLTDEEVRKEIGMRFLADPHFKVLLNDQEIGFNDIPNENIEILNINIDQIGVVKVTVIDVTNADKSTQQHGIAWHVNGRLVGECTWKGSGNEHLIDRRKSVAKRYTFIVEADCLSDAIMPDWTAFISSNAIYKKVFPEVQQAIKSHILMLTQSQREESFKEIEDAIAPKLKQMGLVQREKWEKFIKAVQEDCPSIDNDDLQKLSILLVNLEQSESKYSLIDFLSKSSVDELDNLTDLLAKWDIDFAKIVLDEIEYRTTLLEKLQLKVLNTKSDEVQDLQPLFHRGLWIFGPEYETISFTSNRGMTAVVQDLCGVKDGTGSKNRPDFAILPNSTVGLYSLAKFDDQGAEVGVDRLTIVELKRPGVPIGDEENSQPWKYVSELYKKGLLRKDSVVTCFVLGSEIESDEVGVRTYKDEAVKIIPLTYDTVVRRAKSRLLNLHDKIKNVDFLKDQRIKQYLLEKAQSSLF